MTSQSVFTAPDWLFIKPQNVSLCSPELDNSWGPFHHCRFDFTIFFEQTVLSAVPALVLAMLACPRIYKLWKQEKKTHENPIRTVKAVSELE
jgi:hypothetical protein